MTKNESAPAFARTLGGVEGLSRYAEAQAGLTKLEYFTAAALTGLLAGDSDGSYTEEKAARIAVKQARAVLNVLSAQADT